MLKTMFTPLLIFICLQSNAAPLPLAAVNNNFISTITITEPDSLLSFNYADLLLNGESSATISDTKNWHIFPVPARSILTLQYKGIEKNKGVINVVIYSTSGWQAARLRYSSVTTNMQIPVDHLCRGTYTIQITIEKKLVWQQGFVK